MATAATGVARRRHEGKERGTNGSNRKRCEGDRAQREARNVERRQEAGQVGEKLDGADFIVIRQAGETGQLYGSVSTRDVAEILEAGGFTVARNQVELNQPIKTLGVHTISIRLHPEVAVSVTVNIARSPDEATRQARGEDVLSYDQFAFEEDEDEDAEASAEAEDATGEEPEATEDDVNV